MVLLLLIRMLLSRRHLRTGLISYCAAVALIADYFEQFQCRRQRSGCKAFPHSKLFAAVAFPYRKKPFTRQAHMKRPLDASDIFHILRDTSAFSSRVAR